LPERYNCDLYFGVAIDYIENNLIVSSLSKVNYTAALLSFYNMIDDPQAYISNSVSDLNISNASIKSSITESLANQLANLRCNSLVLFDTGSPSIYGDRTLSLLPNLRYSHIARNFIRLRKIIRDYLETKKFCLNTPFSIDTYVNYISHTILDSYESSGILSNYNVTYSTAGTSVYINVTLTFNPSLSIMNLTFTI
jgi:hypothetical protein